MARESVHAKLERVRPPRGHVTYDVEIGDAIELKEIPFVMGVLGDFSGHAGRAAAEAIKERRFVEITPDNFDAVLESMKPRVAFSVENKLCAKTQRREPAGRSALSRAWTTLSPSKSRGR